MTKKQGKVVALVPQEPVIENVASTKKSPSIEVDVVGSDCKVSQESADPPQKDEADRDEAPSPTTQQQEMEVDQSAKLQQSRALALLKHQSNPEKNHASSSVEVAPF